ncbi:hypothetical protein HDU96_006197 [Phlyctochytrium bullatum]|nr:hypothetical protein HDU96_006197 [Phlyctochytrium bullatum]
MNRSRGLHINTKDLSSPQGSQTPLEKTEKTPKLKIKVLSPTSDAIITLKGEDIVTTPSRRRSASQTPSAVWSQTDQDTDIDGGNDGYGDTREDDEDVDGSGDLQEEDELDRKRSLIASTAPLRGIVTNPGSMQGGSVTSRRSGIGIGSAFLSSTGSIHHLRGVDSKGNVNEPDPVAKAAEVNLAITEVGEPELLFVEDGARFRQKRKPVVDDNTDLESNVMDPTFDEKLEALVDAINTNAYHVLNALYGLHAGLCMISLTLFPVLQYTPFYSRDGVALLAFYSPVAVPVARLFSVTATGASLAAIDWVAGFGDADAMAAAAERMRSRMGSGNPSLDAFRRYGIVDVGGEGGLIKVRRFYNATIIETIRNDTNTTNSIQWDLDRWQNLNAVRGSTGVLGWALYCLARRLGSRRRRRTLSSSTSPAPRTAPFSGSPNHSSPTSPTSNSYSSTPALHRDMSMSVPKVSFAPYPPTRASALLLSPPSDTTASADLLDAAYGSRGNSLLSDSSLPPGLADPATIKYPLKRSLGGGAGRSPIDWAAEAGALRRTSSIKLFPAASGSIDALRSADSGLGSLDPGPVTTRGLGAAGRKASTTLHSHDSTGSTDTGLSRRHGSTARLHPTASHEDASATSSDADAPAPPRTLGTPSRLHPSASSSHDGGGSTDSRLSHPRSVGSTARLHPAASASHDGGSDGDGATLARGPGTPTRLAASASSEGGSSSEDDTVTLKRSVGTPSRMRAAESHDGGSSDGGSAPPPLKRAAGTPSKLHPVDSVSSAEALGGDNTSVVTVLKAESGDTLDPFRDPSVTESAVEMMGSQDVWQESTMTLGTNGNRSE